MPSIPETIGLEIERACERIYPLQNVFIRKVKTMKAPKFDRACPRCKLPARRPRLMPLLRDAQ